MTPEIKQRIEQIRRCEMPEGYNRVRACENDCSRRKKTPDRCGRYRAAPPHHPVHPVTQSGAVQTLAGTGGTGPH